MKKAAIYLRSSKDRADASIDAQRHELESLSKSREILIIAEYADAVESGKTEHRPGFQRLLTDLRSPSREWSHLLMTDTSRLARRMHIAFVFRHECKKRGVQVLFSKVPAVDPITQVILDSVLSAFDEVHSLMSREKGLAGMAENVRKGFRAGGRAPSGYRLKKIATGAVRDGEAVTKSVLVPGPDAAIVRRYLKARAAGVPRAKILRDTGLMLSVSTLIGIEWNALTYAGNTVWNVHAERMADGGYKGGSKRRPRSEWIIQENTHKALITSDEAEVLLHHLETSEIGAAVSKAKTSMSNYLLTGLLYTPDGTAWRGNGGIHYRTKPELGQAGRWIRCDGMDQAITEQIIADIRSADFVRALTEEARKQIDDPIPELQRELIAINGQISKTMDLAGELDDPAPAIRKINELESRRRQLSNEIARSQSERRLKAGITEKRVSRLLEGMNGHGKELISALVDRIVLDPVTLECQIHYRIQDRLTMASPRDSDGWPALRMIKKLAL